MIGAETFSRILDWKDRSTCVLFGDGAGAVVLREQGGDGTSADRGILSNCLHSDGQYHDLLYVDGGPPIYIQKVMVLSVGMKTVRQYTAISAGTVATLLSQHNSARPVAK